VLRRRGSSCQVGVWTGEKTGFGREKKRVDEGKGRLRSRGSSWDRAWVQMLSACAAVAHFDGVRVVWVMDGSSALASVRGGVHEVVPLWGAVLVVQCEVKCVPRFSLQGGGGAAFPCDVSRAKPGYMLKVALKPCLFGWRVGLACAIWLRGGGVSGHSTCDPLSRQVTSSHTSYTQSSKCALGLACASLCIQLLTTELRTVPLQ
jgi:hypothetical protein